MINRKSIKREAREMMRNSSPAPFLVSLVVSVLMFAAMVPSLLLTFKNPENPGTMAFFWDILSNLLGWVLSAGIVNYLLAVHRGYSTSFQEVWDSFGIAGKIIWLQIRISVQTALWGMLFVVPGIVAAYRYRFAIYHLLDNPALSAGEALHLSCAKTNGWKLELFCLELSFLGVTFLLVGIPALAVSLASALVLEAAGEIGVMILMMIVLAVPVAWLQAYMGLAQIGLYRAAVPDVPAENGEMPENDTPWEY